jgi:antitoxin component YwqK of YwqJK toxin-antitoxin module
MNIDKKETNKIDSNGLKQGLWRHWDIDGHLMLELTYVNGVFHGLYRRWHYGKLSCEVYFINGILEGEQIHYGY